MKTRRTNRSLRLPRYAAAAVAATASPALPAAIIHVTTSFNVNTPNTSVNWDIDGGGVSDFTFYNFKSGGTIGSVYTGFRSIYARRLTASNTGNAWVRNALSSNGRLRALPANFNIGPAAVFQSYTNVRFTRNGGEYVGSGPGTYFVGFKFLLTGQTHYGWANITLGRRSLTVNDWAYESSPNTAIAASAVPEPAQSATGLGLLAFGAAGVAAFKRRAKANLNAV